MRVKAFTQLAAWQHVTDLRHAIIAVVRRRDASDRRWCERALSAVAVTSRALIAGSRRLRRPVGRARLEPALRTLFEIQGHLRDAGERGYLRAGERDEAIAISRRAIGAVVRLTRPRDCPPRRIRSPAADPAASGSTSTRAP